jgi:hypothetical protein
MLVATDRTWRFRYRVGDAHHHRFWGQVLRWAAADKLQAGTQYVQLGTDQLSYQPGQPVHVTAKLTDSYFAPLEDPEAVIRVYRGEGEDVVLTRPLERSPDAPGTFSADLAALEGSGRFRLVLDSPQAARVFAGEYQPVETYITIAAPETRSAELLEPTADRAALGRLASVSGGTLVEADDLARVTTAFAPGTQRYTESHSVSLWDTWPLLAAMIALLTLEWTIRKTGGLI